uniref:Uncharacterized protein n=1 Tax=Elaeophora elaphi TaxID=1147741 RepID=A0A0R3RVW5_9BILA
MVISVDEWPREIVKPTTTTLPTTTNTTTTTPLPNFYTTVTGEPTTIGTIPTTTTTITTTVTTTTNANTNTNTATTAAPTVLSTIIGTSDTVSSASFSVSSMSSSTVATTSTLIDFGSVTTIEPKSFPFSTSSNDYHFRKITPAKKFKFAQKFRRQPRLKIRKPDEKGPLRGNQTAFGRNPIILPQLEPLNLENEVGETNDANGSLVIIATVLEIYLSHFNFMENLSESQLSSII